MKESSQLPKCTFALNDLNQIDKWQFIKRLPNDGKSGLNFFKKSIKKPGLVKDKEVITIFLSLRSSASVAFHSYLIPIENEQMIFIVSLMLRSIPFLLPSSSFPIHSWWFFIIFYYDDKVKCHSSIQWLMTQKNISSSSYFFLPFFVIAINFHVIF